MWHSRGGGIRGGGAERPRDGEIKQRLYRDNSKKKVKRREKEKRAGSIYRHTDPHILTAVGEGW